MFWPNSIIFQGLETDFEIQYFISTLSVLSIPRGNPDN